MTRRQDTAPKHMADRVDGPTLPGITVVVPDSGGRRRAVKPDERPTQTMSAVSTKDGFVDGFEESAVEHTDDLEALAAGGRLAFIGAFGARVVAGVADTIRWSARWGDEYALTLAKLLIAVLSALVAAGVGVGWWLS